MTTINYTITTLSNKRFLVSWSGLTPGSNPPIDSDVGQPFDAANSRLISVGYSGNLSSIAFRGSNEVNEPVVTVSNPGTAVLITGGAAGNPALFSPTVQARWYVPLAGGSSGSGSFVALFEEV